ncbi:MAG: alginate export family protein, partial [Bacteroidota bacterium]
MRHLSGFGISLPLAYLLCLCVPIKAQEESDKLLPPPLLLFRAEEQYDYLQKTSRDQYKEGFLDGLKFIPLNINETSFLSIGGSYRARVEHFTNRDYTPEDERFYSQRLSIHTSLHIGAKLRVFGELYHGFTSGEERFIESDDIDLHQGFLEWKVLTTSKGSIDLRLGRQEIGYGVSRLVGIREGPNIRRSFDLAKLVLTKRSSSINLLYGKEVNNGFEAFDNVSNLFDQDAANPQLWGIYASLKAEKTDRAIDLYYLGFRSVQARFNDVVGEEVRHSIGVRSYGHFDRFGFNTEFTYQFGELGSSSISAFNFETDWTYLLQETGWKPKLGIRLDWSSGDQELADDKLNTFNPLFVNPAIYSLAAVNTPANLLSFHPNLTVVPAEGLSIYIDYALFFRANSTDGLYTPARFLLRESMGSDERHIGDVIGLQLQYEFNRN